MNRIRTFVYASITINNNVNLIADKIQENKANLLTIQYSRCRQSNCISEECSLLLASASAHYGHFWSCIFMQSFMGTLNEILFSAHDSNVYIIIGNRIDSFGSNTTN